MVEGVKIHAVAVSQRRVGVGEGDGGALEAEVPVDVVRDVPEGMALGRQRAVHVLKQGGVISSPALPGSSSHAGWTRL